MRSPAPYMLRVSAGRSPAQREILVLLAIPVLPCFPGNVALDSGADETTLIGVIASRLMPMIF